MAPASLVFNQQGRPVQGGPVALVFGAGGLLPPTVVVEGGGRVTGLRGHVRLRVAVRAMAVGRVTGLRGTIDARWDANVSRGTARAELGFGWQQARPVAVALATGWQQAAPLHAATVARWQEAAPRRAPLAVAWQEADRLRATVATAWQEGSRRRAAMDTHWQEAVQLRAAIATAWQDGQQRRAALSAHWQETLRLRAAVATHWQDAGAVRALLATRWGHGRAVHVHLRAHWQEAMRPRAGRSGIVPPVQPPCYVPRLPVDLVFRDPVGAGLPVGLVFRCDGWVPVLPPAGIVVPARRSYIVSNSIEIRRADDLAGDPLPSESFSMRLDRQSWTWTFSAAFHASARDAVAPSPGGQPVELEVRVNGQPFRLQAERIGRSRRFPEHLVTAQGRGLAAVLDAPHAPVQTFSAALDRTAHQLMTDVLTVNGVGYGWAVDFQLADWLVPGGIWMHQGTPISALAEIAGAVGGYLQPHDTAAVMRVLPLWPEPWWRWDTLAPDIELPDGIAEITETEIIDMPAYDRIFVAGEAGGIQADLTRAGLPGLVLKQPMAVHPLITTIGAAKQRATAELAESGRMLKHKMTMPVLPATGVIKPGTVLRYVDDAEALRLGLVRATDVSQQFPVLTQALEIDSHA
ncbi:hypothetical protein [Acidovorax sp. MR-S7]|uniref:hypothetical protein n=1 Tax=Acidovorax sp. MR-S7 TaxID=1268622 RepID=UPI0003736249|nr:hypothetical protein [Acidovorax sp. MR-S7]GAD22358.1 hypothetical protein AVS7_02118 [Acidovorax sp. MR-S7]